jgi:hypothetical protein
MWCDLDAIELLMLNHILGSAHRRVACVAQLGLINPKSACELEGELISLQCETFIGVVARTQSISSATEYIIGMPTKDAWRYYEERQ